MATATELLDLDGVGQRSEGMRFELRDQYGTYLGAVTPQRVVTIGNNGESVLKRTIDNFVLTPDVLADVDLIADRVWPYWVLSDGTEYRLGEMLFAAAAGVRWSYGVPTTAKLLDKGLILGQSPSFYVGFAEGTLVTDAIEAVFSYAGINGVSIAPSVVTTPAPLAWPTGSSTTWAKILTELCRIAGLTDWYFANDGTPTVASMPDLATASPTLRYNAGGRIIAGSAVEENDLLAAPNRYIAVDTSSREVEIVGIFDLPYEAPNSIDKRGFPMTRFIDAPGVGTVASAEAYAAAYAQTDPRAHEIVTFHSSADPRHETFDVVEYLGVNYQELAWSLTGAPGGPMQHKIKRVYQ